MTAGRSLAGGIVALGHAPLLVYGLLWADGVPLGLAAASLAAFAILDRVARLLLAGLS